MIPNLVCRNQSDLSGEIYVNVHEHGQATITELSEQVGYVLSIHESHLLKPKVDSNWYNKEISENASIGSSIGVAAFAEDLDGDEIFYSLAKDVSGLFAIDGTSGVITLIGGFDYETSTSHVITVTATSNGEPGFETISYESTITADVTINVQDDLLDNDNYDVSIPIDINGIENIMSEAAIAGLSYHSRRMRRI